jgi:hypothetical protein
MAREFDLPGRPFSGRENLAASEAAGFYGGPSLILETKIIELELKSVQGTSCLVEDSDSQARVLRSQNGRPQPQNESHGGCDR